METSFYYPTKCPSLCAMESLIIIVMLLKIHVFFCCLVVKTDLIYNWYSDYILS